MPLTARERTCLEWTAAGKTSYETGQILRISPRTVDYHLQNVCGKLGVHSRQAAVAMAMQLNMLPNLLQLLPRAPRSRQDATPEPVHEKTRRPDPRSSGLPRQRQSLQ